MFVNLINLAELVKKKKSVVPDSDLAERDAGDAVARRDGAHVEDCAKVVDSDVWWKLTLKKSAVSWTKATSVHVAGWRISSCHVSMVRGLPCARRTSASGRR